MLLRLCQRLLATCALVLTLTLTGMAQEEGEAPQKGADFLNPSGGQLTIGGEEGFGLGSQLADPSALKGPDRTPIVLPGTERNSSINLTGYYLHRLGDNSRILAEFNGDDTFLGFDLGYMVKPEGWEGVLGFNVTGSSGLASAFGGGNRAVPLVSGDEDIWVRQFGAGMEYVQSYTEELDMAVALGYQKTEVAETQFGGSLAPSDRSGSPLTISPLGRDELIFLGTHGIYSTLNDRNLPTEGTKIRFGLQQALPAGSSDISYTRLSANFAHLFEVPGPGSGASSFLVNLQGGTTSGDIPPWAGYNLGGVNSVRGYISGELATSAAFFQATAEYRPHLFDFQAFENDFTVRGVAFVDWATDLRTSNKVFGRPGILRGKQGHGTGYGLGVQLGTPGGLFRLETAWNDQNRNSFFITVGDRF